MLIQHPCLCELHQQVFVDESPARMRPALGPRLPLSRPPTPTQVVSAAPTRPPHSPDAHGPRQTARSPLAASSGASDRPGAPPAVLAKPSKGQKRKLALQRKKQAGGATPASTPRGAQSGKKRIAPAAARESKTADGRWKFDGEGVPLCWAFNRKANGCQTPCGEGRSHRCEWCRGACRAIECSQKPSGWVPPS